MKVVAVWTRKDEAYPGGRPKIAREVRAILDGLGHTRHVWLSTLLTRKAPRDLARAAWRLMRYRLPLQCTLFDTVENERLAAVAADADVVYLDGVRTLTLLRALKRQPRRPRIVLDMDDLMSKRMRLLDELRLGISPGYMTQHFPAAMLAVIGRTSRLLVKYEAWALQRAEDEIMRSVDDVVLLSSIEADELAKRGGTARVHTIAPSERLMAEAQQTEPPVRFVFIGQDSQTQNRLAIEYLIKLWRDHGIAAPLHLVGKLSRRYDFPPNVLSHGFVADLAEVYDRNTVMLAPAILGGGIKTKILEAFAYGCPVIGNDLAFSALPVRDLGYPLVLDEAAMLAVLERPEDHLSLCREAAAIGAAYVRQFHSPEPFAVRWRELIAGAQSAIAIPTA